ncbi:hypothetical protein WN51_09260 [Melipona quadrifasciata]|uniref:Uncharacterized protein n=1 Tax=Melipona quadrifasciata TaxID=166423 RepID=A0A0M9A6R6_9HYME|nr:hypothetical protein WN51_09260 [Melipona quadrifasciata]
MDLDDHDSFRIDRLCPQNGHGFFYLEEQHRSVLFVHRSLSLSGTGDSSYWRFLSTNGHQQDTNCRISSRRRFDTTTALFIIYSFTFSLWLFANFEQFSKSVATIKILSKIL